MTASENIRCFLAAHLSTEALRALTDVQHDLHARCQKSGLRLRWVPVENLHITLKFFGDIPAALVPAIEREVARVVTPEPVVPLDIVGVGAFPNLQRARVLWAGLREDTARIASLQRRIEDAMETLGFPREERPYVAHLTLARARGGETVDVREVASQLAYAPIGRTTVREIILYQSVLGPDGARYTPLRRSRFDEGAADGSQAQTALPQTQTALPQTHTALPQTRTVHSPDDTPAADVSSGTHENAARSGLNR